MGKKRWGRNKEVQDTDPVKTTEETADVVEETEPEQNFDQDAAFAENLGTEEQSVKSFEEAAAAVEAKGIDPVAPVEVKTTNSRGVIPDQFGNNVKGERICSECGIKESETLAKNPRYSFCKGKCVNCYGKTERKTVKPGDLTIPQLEEKIAYYKDLLAKKLSGAQGLPEGNAIVDSNVATSDESVVTSGANLVPTTDATDELATIE